MISTSTSTSTKRGRKRQKWGPGTMAVLGVPTWFYPYRGGGLLFGGGPKGPCGQPPPSRLYSAGASVRVLEETLLPNRRGAPLRRVLVEAGGSGPYAWVDADDLEPAF